MSFPTNFLTVIASEKQLTQKETEIFLALFGDGKSRVQITQELHISDSVIGTRLSGIYRKFKITGSGPVKESRLKDYLTRKCLPFSSTGLENSADSEQNIDRLVQEMRQRVQPDIQERCGTMRVLEMTHPIALGDIYTNVNILDKITGRRGLERSELMLDVSGETFERYGLGDIRERRVPGLEAVKKFSKLMILGKPGAGKTTFLKHLAIACIGGGFQSEYLPVFVTLKDFAETKGQPDLLEYITDPSPTPPRSWEGLSSYSIRKILAQGRALILLDGLDEVKEVDNSRILRQIRQFSQDFYQNQFIITCRIAAREYTFETFTEVEIADFNDEQIADFSGKWFCSKNDPIKAKLFWERLTEDEPIRELATNPLLLTLLCLVFEDSGSFPNNRSELYQTGVDVWLKKWDVKRNIEREQVYKRLSLKRKEDLLSQIARTTFEAGNYFFKQREVERYITQYIQNLPDASTDPEALELDSVAVLKSIEAQHGLFVERARGIYSFSHLTFHEYFTARKIVTSCNPYAADDPTLQMLVSHLTEKRWREVFLLTVGMLDSADVLLRLMKERIDKLLVEDEQLQQFLKWVDERSKLVKSCYKLAAVRAFYIVRPILVLSRISEYAHIFKLAFTIDQTFKADFYLASDLESASIQNNIRNNTLAVINFIANALKSIYDFERSLSYARQLDLDDALTFEVNLDCFLDCTGNLDRALALDLELEQKYSLKMLRNELPDPCKDQAEFQRWWLVNGESWTEKLREQNEIIAQYHIVDDRYKFNDKQKKFLRQYYDANQLLVDCLNSDCYVSREVRQEIEETLLLPIAEIEKFKQLNLQ